MTLKAVFIHADRALTGPEEDRAALRDFVTECSARRFNVVAVSDLNKADLTTALNKAGIAGKVIYALDSETAVKRNLAPTTGPATFKEALGALNSMRCTARAEILDAAECVAVTDVRKTAAAAAKAGIETVCIEGNLREGRQALDFALSLR